MDGTKCPKCERVVQKKQQLTFTTMYICYKKCGFVFWKLRICPHCQQMKQDTIYLTRPDVGSIVSCNSCKNRMVFYICPFQSCYDQFYLPADQQVMGTTIHCWNKKYQHYFKQILCQCGKQQFFDPSVVLLQGFTPINCTCCKKSFRYTVCPYCRRQEYHLQQLQIGDRLRCKNCLQWRRYVPCPKCGISLKQNTFNFCQPIYCQQCNFLFEYTKCPYGCPQLSYNILQNLQNINPHRTCHVCNNSYFAIKCNKCQITLYQNQLDKGLAVIDNCANCKYVLKYALCQCGCFNNNDVKCKIPVCNKKINLIDYIAIKENQIKKKQKQLDKKNKQKQKQESKECKICFDGVCNYINQQCGHVMMCETCVRNVSRGSNRAPCPACRTIGRYFKYKQAIFP